MALETWVTGASWLMLLLAPVTAVSLLCWSPAPYGRHHKKEWGAGLNPKVAWMTQEAPSCLLPLLLLARAPRDLWAGMRPDQATLIAMFLAHYVRRSFAYPLLLRGGKPTALAPWLLAIVFCCWNGFIQGASLIYFWPRQRRLWDWKWLLGASLWGLGWAGNLHSDHLLRCLRHPGEQGYKIPRGGLFEYVSAANYLAESVEWLGFAIACWSLPAAAFAAFTLSNLGPRALQHHRWYQDRFGSAYPPQRTAFLPFLL